MLAVFNEAAAIDECLASLAAQDYEGPWEILVADGGSTDGTVDRIGDWSEELRIRVFDNPDRLQSKGLNLLAEVAAADILVRADAHTTYAPDYLTRSVSALLSTGASAVGGPMRPEGSTTFGRAVANAYRSKIGIGPAPFHHSEENIEADTVYLGTMARQTFIDQGGLRTLPSGVAEDADFYYRLRQDGGRVLVVPEIRSSYRPRQTPGGLWRQFYRYGLGKADMLYINGEFPSWRPLAPLGLLIGLCCIPCHWLGHRLVSAAPNPGRTMARGSPGRRPRFADRNLRHRHHAYRLRRRACARTIASSRCG